MIEAKTHAPDLQEFEAFSWSKHENYIYIGAGGFEDRAACGASLLTAANIPIVAAVILEFRNRNVPEHLRNERKIRGILSKHVPKESLFERQVVTAEELPELLSQFRSGTNRPRVIVDISAMPHSLILRTLRTIRSMGEIPIILYTEADEYYPKERDARKYLEIQDDELAFDAAARQENKQIMYAGLASVGIVKGFEGRITPTAPTSIILFPTFKRLRVSSILMELEVKTRIFMLSKPEREDLAWRERALRVINYDLIDPDTDHLVTVSTLSPSDCLKALCGLFDKGLLTPRGNTIICPHGSKMQTVGVWEFCETYRDVRVILSHPTEFFPKKYSVGNRDTFVFEPSFAAANGLPKFSESR